MTIWSRGGAVGTCCNFVVTGQFCGYTYPVVDHIGCVGLGSPGCSTATQRPMLAARGHATVRGELACTWHCRTPRLAVARCRPGGAVRDIFESHGTPGFGGARPDGPSTALALDTQCGSRSTGWPWGVSARQLPPMAATAAIGADGAVADVTEGRLRAALGQLPAALGQLRHEPHDERRRARQVRSVRAVRVDGVRHPRRGLRIQRHAARRPAAPTPWRA